MSLEIREEKLERETILEVPGNKAPIETLWAWISVDKDGKEGVMASGALPLVSGDKALMEKFQAKINEISKDSKVSGYTFVLSEFKRVR